MTEKDEGGAPYEAGYNRPEMIIFHQQAEYDRALAMVAREKDPVVVFNSLQNLIKRLKALIIAKNPDLRKEVEKVVGKPEDWENKTRVNFDNDSGVYTAYYDHIPQEFTEHNAPVMAKWLFDEMMLNSQKKCWHVLGELEIIAFREGVFDPVGWRLDHSHASKVASEIQEYEDTDVEVVD